MTLKMETVKKLIETMEIVFATWTKRLIKGERVQASISDKNDKIGNTMNISFAPILACGKCEDCMCSCYAVKNLVRRGMTVINAWVKNWALFCHDRDEFFRQIRAKMARRRKNKFLRWHIAGDIVDRDHFERMNNVAVDFPDWREWTYTEMHHIVNKFCDDNGRDAIPETFNIMFSDWSLKTGVPIHNPYHFKRFIIVPKGTPKDAMPKGFYCPGNCDFCKDHKCGCVYGTCDVYCKEH